MSFNFNNNQFLARKFEINISTPEGQLVTISNPFTVKFNIKRNTLASTNSCTLTINNLGPETRSLLFKDRFTFTEYWQMSILAGYNTRKLVFLGNVLECYSYKSGTEWITEITAFDGLYGVQNGFISETINKGATYQQLIAKVLSTIPLVSRGVIGDPAEADAPKRGTVMVGRSAEIMDKLTGGRYFIDNETMNVISRDEYIGEGILELTSSILLETPKRQDALMSCKTLFFPEANIANGVRVTSLQSEYDGLYKIIGLDHTVTISGSEGGTAITTLELDAGAKVLRRAIL